MHPRHLSNSEQPINLLLPYRHKSCVPENAIRREILLVTAGEKFAIFLTIRYLILEQFSHVAWESGQ